MNFEKNNRCHCLKPHFMRIFTLPFICKEKSKDSFGLNYFLVYVCRDCGRRYCKEYVNPLILMVTCD